MAVSVDVFDLTQKQNLLVCLEWQYQDQSKTVNPELYLPRELPEYNGR